MEGTHGVDVRALGPDLVEYWSLEGFKGVEYETSGLSALAGLDRDVLKERVGEVCHSTEAREISASEEAFHAGDTRDEPIHVLFTCNIVSN